ncbi:murein biosynthesis integral membrane protein MurJ [Aneurinibacillus terranovensis]|uniref:murein biosynthesis integral membrane protein MurJ n=1 Tax=Aneurinibacillus terranovensis TaxID=278991 RepID=UPI000413C2E8|nr:murein biosynthesis integral membrane protein MurJ [Aneurinibacillus terranovensis]
MAQTIARSAAIIMVVTLVGRVVGLFREMLLANQFGANYLADAYTLGFTIPSTIFLFIPGALNAIFVPSIKSMLVRNRKEEAESLFKKVLSLTVILYLIITIIGMFFSKELVIALSKGEFKGIELQTATLIMQIMWPSAVFIALIGVFQSTLNAHQMFFIPTLSTVVNSIVVCAAYPLLVPFYGIYGVAAGTTIGFAFAAFTMLPAVRREKYPLQIDFKWNTPEMKKIGERFLPIMLGSFVTQIYSFIYPFLASGLGEGKLASLRYANNLYQLPMAIFVAAFTLPIFPYLVEYFTNGQLAKMKASITEGMQYLFILMVPTITAMVVMPDQLVSLIYHFGKHSEFTSASVKLTSTALIYMSAGLFFLAARDLLTRAFYAMEKTKITVIAAIAGIISNILASVVLIPFLGHGGIALGTSVGSLVNMLWLAYYLRKDIGAFIGQPFWITAGKTIAASCIMGVVLYLGTVFTFQSLFIQKVYTLAVIAAGAAAFFAAMVMLREQLAVRIIERFTGKLTRKRLKEEG